jgi:hypothetical protein
MSEGLGSKGEAALLALICVKVVRYTRPPKASADVKNLSSFNEYWFHLTRYKASSNLLHQLREWATPGESVLHGEDMTCCKVSRKAEFPDVRGGTDY